MSPLQRIRQYAGLVHPLRESAILLSMLNLPGQAGGDMARGSLDNLKQFKTPQGWWALRKIFTRDMPGGFLHNVGWQYGGTAASAAIGFLYVMLVARAMGAERFGLIALGLSVAAVVSPFAMLRQREMIIRYLAQFRAGGDYPRVLAVTKLSLLLDGICGIAAFLIVLCVSPWAATHVLRDPGAVPLILVAGLAYILQNIVSDTALGVLRLFARFRTLATVEACGAAFKLASALLAVYLFKAGVMGVLLALLATNLLVDVTLLTLALVQLSRLIPLRSPAALSLLKPHAREIRRFLTHNYFISLTGIAVTDLDITLVGYFASREAAGIYKVAKSFVIAMSQVTDAAFVVVYPELARMWAAREFARLKAFARRLSLSMCAAGVLMYGAAFLAVPWIIARFMKAEFAGAGTVFRCMGWGIVLSAPFVWVFPLFAAAGRPDLNLWAALCSTIATVLLYLVAIPHAGAAGAAMVYAASAPLFAAAALAMGRRAGLLFPKAEPMTAACEDCESGK